MIAEIVPLPGVRRLPPATATIEVEYSVADVLKAFPDLSEEEALGVLHRFVDLTVQAFSDDKVATLRGTEDLIR